ncbi:hypothetical protein NEOLEDRAFT_1137574 [Neolentinus lepideus HHB14362 ss-1]|uniref:Bacterial surface antigen (D15) domain-containing protein n=1 Tax=Neolentinus lepideus HHB14362 ss-1 TaxID=1314782 RepID=A0A165QRE3_9AGAM|nr:hypothetical protein NEOLEDRAFT_1137574 [Neolentinus lepideus HHB14362 ss-1]
MDAEDDLFSPRLNPPLQNTSASRDKEPDDLQKLKQWQEERLARRLRGEYESAILRLSELVNSNLETPVRIASVRVEGAPHTRSSFLGFLINPLLPPVTSDSTLESVLHTTRRISHILQDSDIFSHIEAKLDASRDPLATNGDVDVILKTREKGRFYAKTSTEFGNNEGGASATARVRNAFGGAESLEANVSLGTKTRRSYYANLSLPVSSNLQTWADASVFGMDRDNSSYASCTEGLRGVKAAVRSGSIFSGRHELAYEAVLRHIGSLTPAASMSIREAAGETLKSSVLHSWTLDTRNDKMMATRGVYLKLFQELAGLGGDASFYKAEAETQCSRRICPGVALSGALRTGILWGIGRPTLFSDRFQLGGPTSVRMLRANSMGPRDGADSPGGDLYWSAGVSVISDLPRKPHWPLKLHGFVNAGRLDGLDKSKSLQENVVSCITKPSVSVGVGLIYRFDPVRVEVNFGVPLVASSSDGYRRGFQVGMGLDFL